MAKAIEFVCVEDIVKDSEISNTEDKRKFEYNLNEKSAKAKP